MSGYDDPISDAEKVWNYQESFSMQSRQLLLKARKLTPNYVFLCIRCGQHLTSSNTPHQGNSTKCSTVWIICWRWSSSSHLFQQYDLLLLLSDVRILLNNDKLLKEKAARQVPEICVFLATTNYTAQQILKLE